MLQIQVTTVRLDTLHLSLKSNNIFQDMISLFCCLLAAQLEYWLPFIFCLGDYYHFTKIVTKCLLFRAYKLLFLTYCISLSNQTDESDSRDNGVCRIPRVRNCLPSSSRGGSGSKGLTPPPPYDSPPPYHVAIVMCSSDDDNTQAAQIHISDPIYI